MVHVTFIFWLLQVIFLKFNCNCMAWLSRRHSGDFSSTHFSV